MAPGDVLAVTIRSIPISFVFPDLLLVGAGVGRGDICGGGAAGAGGVCRVRGPRHGGHLGAGGRHACAAAGVRRGCHPPRLLLFLRLRQPLYRPGMPPSIATLRPCLSCSLADLSYNDRTSSRVVTGQVRLNMKRRQATDGLPPGQAPSYR